MNHYPSLFPVYIIATTPKKISRGLKALNRELAAELQQIQLSVGLKSWKRAGNKVVNRESYFLGRFSTSASRLAARRRPNRVPKNGRTELVLLSGNSSPEVPKELIYLS